LTRFSKIWIGLISVGFLLFLLSYHSENRSVWVPLERLVIEMAAPFQKLISRTIRSTRDIWFGYFDLVDVRRENIRLKTQIDALSIESFQYRELLATHERIQGLLQFKKTVNHPVLAAEVIGLDPTGWFKSIIIDKGEHSGVAVDMPVVDSDGVVGRIVSVSADSAKVLLLIDQNSAVDCLVQRSRARCMVKGVAQEVCKLIYLAESSDVAVGDVLVTSGLGGVYPKGLPVGQVLRVKEASGALFRDIDVLPSVDFSKLEEVLVILKEN
jgi:rod shape-determining protein MreC